MTIDTAPAQAAGSALDLSPLSSRVTGADRREFRSRWRARAREENAVAGVIAMGLLSLVFAVFVLSFVALAVSAAVAMSGGSTNAVPVVICVLVAAAFAVPLWWSTRRLVRIARSGIVRGTRWVRMERFARANPGVGFQAEISWPRYAGILFAVGADRRAHGVLRFAGPQLEVGSYSFTGIRQQDRGGVTRGYARMLLPRQVPNLLLVRQGRGKSALPMEVRPGQALKLEGDFDRTFRLYAPAGYERDALYIMAPDLMALLVDSVAAFDVEIVDGVLNLYSAREPDLTDPLLIARLHAIAELVSAKAHRQTAGYRDERAPYSGAVAETGRRLRWRVPVITSIAGAAILVWQGARILHLLGVW